MPSNPPDNMPRITPYLLYEDVAAALDWLAKAFGFRERLRLPGSDGAITHAEMEMADGVVMMGHPGPDYKNPKRLGQVTLMVHVYVDDVDAHYERAKAAGAKIVAEPTDQFYGDRREGMIPPPPPRSLEYKRAPSPRSRNIVVPRKKSRESSRCCGKDVSVMPLKSEPEAGSLRLTKNGFTTSLAGPVAGQPHPSSGRRHPPRGSALRGKACRPELRITGPPARKVMKPVLT